MHHPDRTRADNQDYISGVDVERVLSSKDTGKGFHQGGHGRIHRLADRDDISLLDRVGGNEDIISKAAITRDAKGILHKVVPRDALATVTGGVRRAKTGWPTA
jgi:hypothetical protein